MTNKEFIKHLLKISGNGLRNISPEAWTVTTFVAMGVTLVTLSSLHLTKLDNLSTKFDTLEKTIDTKLSDYEKSLNTTIVQSLAKHERINSSFWKQEMKKLEAFKDEIKTNTDTLLVLADSVDKAESSLKRVKQRMVEFDRIILRLKRMHNILKNNRVLLKMLNISKKA